MPEFVDTFSQLPELFYSQVAPTPPEQPFLISVNKDARALLGLPEEVSTSPDFLAWFTGSRLLPGAAPTLATAYAGHQFGSFVPQLGDGRAHLLGQIRNAKGELWEIQLKGSGKTPYSRFGDGRAVLRSSIREYLCSEAMHALGIPTTRALCLIGSEEKVRRETIEKGALVTRLSPSFVRFGHFEYAAFTLENPEAIRQLADHVIAHHYPNHQGNYEGWLGEIVMRTAHLMAHWQAVGFAHGVMNTDNFSILGLTIDYGPFGFLDAFDPGYICNHSDHTGRYAFDQQPTIGWWNLHVLAYALGALIPAPVAKEILSEYWPHFIRHYRTLMNAKLGITAPLPEEDPLLANLFDLLTQSRADYTHFFRALSHYAGDGDPARLAPFLPDATTRTVWLAMLQERWQTEALPAHERSACMLAVNPKYILRNYLAEQAIRLATLAGDYSEIDRLMTLLRRPFDEQPDMEHYAASPPEWASALCISCSS
jgi:uncharacterized protein YdiU (UPF0061 family)